MIKFLIGGSPCTRWSIAQSKNRETTAEGVGWELFKNYLIARERFAPDFFLYENNKSAAQAIKDQISLELGVPLQYINSALVSAQTRQRFYAHNCGNVPQPEDRGIILQDILETGAPVGDAANGTAYALKANYSKSAASNFLSGGGHFPQTGVAVQVGPDMVDYAPHKNSDIVITDNNMRCQRRDKKHSTIQGTHVTFADAKTQTLGTSHIPMTFEQMSFESLADREKAECFRATYDKCGGYQGVPVRIGTIESAAKNLDHDSQQYRVYSPDGKSVTLCGNGGGVGAKTGLYACPVNNTEDRKPVYVVEGGANRNQRQAVPYKAARWPLHNPKADRDRVLPPSNNAGRLLPRRFGHTGV